MRGTLAGVRIAAASDHAGFHLKLALVNHVRALGHDVIDLGTHSDESGDYPDFGAAVGRAVVAGEADYGVCVCGTGIGMSIASNKINGVRAAVVHDVSAAKLAREHNDANVACFGARLIGPGEATDSIEAFLSTGFDGGRHAARIAKIAELETKERA